MTRLFSLDFFIGSSFALFSLGPALGGVFPFLLHLPSQRLSFSFSFSEPSFGPFLDFALLLFFSSASFIADGEMYLPWNASFRSKTIRLIPGFFGFLGAVRGQSFPLQISCLGCLLCFPPV